VLCIRNNDDDNVQFVPRFPSPLRHLASGADGKSVCVSLEENSLALINDLHGWVKPKWIHALDVPIAFASPVGAPGKQPTGTAPAPAPAPAPVAALHVLANGGVAATGGGRRVQFLDEEGKVVPSKSVTLDRSNTVRCGNPMRRWCLRQISFSARASCLLTCEVRRSPALDRFDPDATTSTVLKWWRRDSDGQYTLDSIAHDAHKAEITVAIAHPSREHAFVTASLDGTFKCWDLLVAGSISKTHAADTDDGKENEEPVARASGARCWQCVALGSWRGRPILSGCFSGDGSALALGFHGFAVLWEHDTATELRALPAGEATDRVAQLHSAVAGGRFLLLGTVRAAAGAHQEVFCWDLARLTVIARVNLSAELAGERRCVVRVAPPSGSGSGSALRLLAFRAPGGELRVWRLDLGAAAGAEASFREEAVAMLPKGRQLLDAAFAPPSPDVEATRRVLCWTSDYELWSLDMLAPGIAGADAATPEKRKKKKDQGEMAPIVKDDERQELGPAGRMLGDARKASATGAAAYKDLRFFKYPVRTTAVQQAGITPRLVEQICPPHIPSHMLPPPSALWERLVAVLAKPSPSADLSGAAAAKAVEDGTAAAEKAAAGVEAGAAAGGAAQWLARRKAQDDGAAVYGENTAEAEIVEAAFFDCLVKEVRAAA